eukprot:890707-Amphidinium_carterae.1
MSSLASNLLSCSGFLKKTRVPRWRSAYKAECTQPEDADELLVLGVRTNILHNALENEKAAALLTVPTSVRWFLSDKPCHQKMHTNCEHRCRMTDNCWVLVKKVGKFVHEWKDKAHQKTVSRKTGENVQN